MTLYPLYSGSSGNCSLISHGNTRLLVDAGVSGKQIALALESCKISPESINAILVTHEHSDHIKSVGTISRKYDIPVFANAGTWQAMAGKIGNISEKNIRVFDTNRDFSLSEINVMPFSIPHDTADPVAFTFTAGGKKAAIATDIGHVTQKLTENISDCNIIVIESNHNIDMVKKSSYPQQLQKRILSDKGHLSNESCASLLVHLYQSGVKRAILGHLSAETNTERLAYETVSSILANAGIGADYMLKLAHRSSVCGIFEV